MWEPEESTITALLRAYCHDLPARIESADEADVMSLTSEREKIGRLLQDGYCISLATLEIKPCLQAKSSQRRPVKTERVAPRIEEPLRDDHKTQIDETRVPTLKEVALANESRRRNKIEVEDTIRRLRAEHKIDIPRRLAEGVTEAERQILSARLMNIRILLEHGYRVGISEENTMPLGVIPKRPQIRARVIPDFPVLFQSVKS